MYVNDEERITNNEVIYSVDKLILGWHVLAYNRIENTWQGVPIILLVVGHCPLSW